MRSIRLRIFVICAVVLAAVAGAWRLWPSDGQDRAAIVIGTTDVVTTLDPAGAYDVGSWAVYSNIYQSLLTFKPGGVTPVPDAARACAFTGRALTTYSCVLRDDLTFSNGNKITGADVRHSFERLLAIKAKVGPAPLFPTLKSVTAEGQRITFRLSARDATFPQKLATGAGSIVDRTRYPAGALREGTAADGSGPYLLEEYEPGVRARLVPNPAYKGVLTKTGGPVEIRWFEKAEQLAKAWQDGRLDVAHRRLPPETIASLDPNSSSLRMTESESAEIRGLVFNLRPGAPLAKKAVRKAVAAVVDRGRIAADVHRSTVQPLYSLIPQGTLGHSNPFFDNDPQPSVKRARQLLESAGAELPVSFTLVHSEGSQPAQEAAELRRQLEASGLFRVRVVAEDWTVFQQGYADGKYDAYALGWVPDFPDPDSFTQPLVGIDSTLHNGYRNKAVDELIAETQRYEQRGRAAKVFREIQRLVAADVPVLPLWQRKDYVVNTRDINGAQYLSDGTSVWRLWELDWL
ncbi:ABC transporter substrate-binding protein [Streptomyces sp. CAU 1734]|uniref:ABC transporter substrate-binding protein n=1 Tax=Streptomyces sp. CAU 1734 TaxID=3140360 RepID=UPI0032618273